MKYIIGYKDSSDNLTEFTTYEEAEYEAEEWVEVEADSLEKAKLQYEEAFLAWRRGLVGRTTPAQAIG